MNSIFKLEFAHPDISEGDIVEIGNTRHLLTIWEEEPCVFCSLSALCESVQEYGIESFCNSSANLTFMDVTPNE